MGEWRQRMATQGGRFGGADGAGSCTLWPELQIGFWADVGRPDVEAQHLCGPMGTGRDGEYAGSMESRRRQGEAGGGGPEGADAASCFPGSEFQVESRADVARGMRRPQMAIVQDQ